MEKKIKPSVQVTVTLGAENGKTKIYQIDTFFDIDPAMDAKMYASKDGVPTALGYDLISQILLEGLVGNIHAAHNSGDMDSAAHLRTVISRMERAFVRVVTTQSMEIKK